MTKISWLTEPEEHDYPAAESFLLLLFPAPQVNKIITNLQAAKNVTFKAKDVFRASGLSLLGVSNSHVTKDREKIESGKALSPILLVRDNDGSSLPTATTECARCTRRMKMLTFRAALCEL